MPEPTLPPIQTYHAEIMVNKDDQIQIASIDRRDWTQDEELITKLVQETGATTVGEALTKAGATVAVADELVAQNVNDKQVFDWDAIV